MSVKGMVAGFSPAFVRRTYHRALVGWEFLWDYRQYVASTGTSRPVLSRNLRYRDDLEYLRSRLAVLVHGLEKGATYPRPRRPYGVGRIQDIKSLLACIDLESRPVDRDDADSAVEAVEEYNDGAAISDEISPRCDWSGVRLDPEKTEKFVRSRHSIRNFDREREVSDELIRTAVRLAGLTPSVCNRREYRAHFYSEPEQIRRLLELQNGNVGFRETIPRLIVVSVRRSSFSGAGERNQRWVDGGLFAMSLVWLLHSVGLGTCFLNWSEVSWKTCALRGVGDIPASEDIVVLIAVGYPKSGYRVPRSSERPLKDILVEHKAGDAEL